MESTGVVFDALMRPLNRRSLSRIRSHVIGTASGVVLEIGAGTGENLKHYQLEQVSRLHATDIDLFDLAIRLKWRRACRNGCPELILSEVDVESLPFADGYFDAIVFTLVFCSVRDPLRGLRELHRVLRPGGTIHFIEHVVSPNPLLAALMRRITPAWRRWADNCHLDRSTISTIGEAGFEIESLDQRSGGIFVGGIARKPL